MTPLRTAQARVAREDGFSLVEMLISTGIMVVVTGAIFGMLDPATGAFNTQPEVSDLQQRLRVGVDTLQKDLVMAGAGTYAGESAGSLYNYFAPVMPYRGMGTDADPEKGVYYRPDAISIIYIPPTPSQTTISNSMPPNSSEIKVQPQPNCPSKKEQLCGFEPGMRVLIFNADGAWEPFTVTHVQDAAAHLQHRGQPFNNEYATGSFVTQVRTASYFLKTDEVTETYQLMFYDGYDAELPVVDNVVGLKFDYWGDPNPPELIPNKSLTGPGPWTTYGPKPPALGVQGGTTWPVGENCLFTIQDGRHVPRLPLLEGGGIGQVALDAKMLQDGPWCPDADSVERFDADLLRIRRIRVTLRVQVAQEQLRGPSALLFKYPGNASPTKWVPDQEIRFDVAPRNMNLGR
jgi:hypothetical protein